MSNMQPVHKCVIAGLLGLAFSLSAYASTALKCPKNIQGSQVRFDVANAWWGSTFYLRTSKSYPMGPYSLSWTFYLDDLPAANQNDALQKANVHVSSSTWDLKTDDAVYYFYSWVCAYTVDGNLEAKAMGTLY